MSANDISLKDYFSEKLEAFQRSMDRMESAQKAHQEETRASMAELKREMFAKMQELEQKVDLWTWRGISASFGALLALGLAGWNAFFGHK